MLVVSFGLLLMMLAAVLYRAVFDVPDPAALRELGLLVLPERAPVAPFQLLDQRGRPFGLAELEGRWSLVP